MEARHIMSGSGHKSEASIRSYSKTSKTKRLEMSAHLSNKTSSASIQDDQIPSTSKADPQTQRKKSNGSKHSRAKYFEAQRRPLAERFDMNTFVPNFNLRNGVFSDSDDDGDEGRMEELQLQPQREYNRQMSHFRNGFAGGGG